MPCLDQKLAMLCDQSLDSVNFVIRKPKVLGQFNWFQPELGDVPFPFYMDVNRFAAVRTEKHKPVRTNR